MQPVPVKSCERFDPSKTSGLDTGDYEDDDFEEVSRGRQSIEGEPVKHVSQGQMQTTNQVADI